ncbi:polysaccharide deacetylase family protein [Desulfobacterales bacterium HSG17]|nr:polysaccharide deacetylase family protein [Desulfobacterales bacterium HSG17]
MAGMRIKSIVATLCCRFGLLDFVGWFRLREKAVVLMYHRVIDGNTASSVPVQPGMYVTSATFRKHLRFLKKKFNVISLAELVRRMKEKKSIDSCCVITFDDGWYDNYHTAFPLLQEFQLPATIFLTTGFVGTQRWFWPEKVSCCLQQIQNEGFPVRSLPKELRGCVSQLGFPGECSLDVAIDTVIEYLKSISPDRRKGLLDVVETIIAGKQHEQLLLSWEHVAAMAKSGLVTFGSHTVNHSLLDELGTIQIEREIVDSCKVIEVRTDRPCSSFAYPNGNFSDTVKQMLNKYGIQVAVTTERGYVEAGTQLLVMPRVGVHDDVSSTESLFFWRLVVK